MREEYNMNEIIADCVMRQIDQGYNSRQAFELCAKELEDRSAGEEMGDRKAKFCISGK